MFAFQHRADGTTCFICGAWVGASHEVTARGMRQVQCGECKREHRICSSCYRRVKEQMAAFPEACPKKLDKELRTTEMLMDGVGREVSGISMNAEGLTTIEAEKISAALTDGDEDICCETDENGNIVITTMPHDVTFDKQGLPIYKGKQPRKILVDGKTGRRM